MTERRTKDPLDLILLIRNEIKIWTGIYSVKITFSNNSLLTCVDYFVVIANKGAQLNRRVNESKVSKLVRESFFT